MPPVRDHEALVRKPITGSRHAELLLHARGR